MIRTSILSLDIKPTLTQKTAGCLALTWPYLIRISGNYCLNMFEIFVKKKLATGVYHRNALGKLSLWTRLEVLAKNYVLTIDLGLNCCDFIS